MKNIVNILVSIIFLSISLIGNSFAGETLDNIRKSNKIILCAGPYAWPYTSTANYPRGFDIDIISQIAAKEQLNLDIYWAEQKMRGGLGKALRHSIMKGRCDLYMGIANSDSSKDEIEEKNLVFTIPYLGVGYVPIANPEVVSVPEHNSSPKIKLLLSALFKMDLNSLISTANVDWPLKILSFPDILVNKFL